ncbi:MAG: 2OG-Fe(II) oxygenase [Alphaproteobacteria bacterium]|nr:2OG-Fe(II) oxygenase [Alphaproteobacteria bacterium]
MTGRRVELPLMTVVEAAFTAAECGQIVAAGAALPLEPGKVNDPKASDGVVGGRQVGVAAMPLEPAYNWIYERLVSRALSINEQHLGFEIEQTETIQFLSYAPGQHYDWHVDIGTEEMALRKLSIVAMLSPPSDYDGGELELLFGDRPSVAPRSQGSLIFFPSFVLHRVRPIGGGRRYSLALWLRGVRPFR